MKNTCPACGIGTLTQKFDGTLYSVCEWCKTETTDEIQSRVNKVLKLCRKRGRLAESIRCEKLLRSDPYNNQLIRQYADEIAKMRKDI